MLEFSYLSAFKCCSYYSKCMLNIVVIVDLRRRGNGLGNVEERFGEWH